MHDNIDNVDSKAQWEARSDQLGPAPLTAATAPVWSVQTGQTEPQASQLTGIERIFFQVVVRDMDAYQELRLDPIT